MVRCTDFTHQGDGQGPSSGSSIKQVYGTPVVRKKRSHEISHGIRREELPQYMAFLQFVLTFRKFLFNRGSKVPGKSMLAGARFARMANSL